MRVADVQSIFRALNEADVKYLVVGGLAVNAHGYLRVTIDADIVRRLEPGNVARAMHALEAIGYQPLVPVAASEFADPEKRRSWIQEKHMIVFQMRNPDRDSTRLDIFVAEPFPFEETYQHTFWDALHGVRVPIVPYEELVRLKTAAGRPQDMLDLQQLELIRQNRQR